VLIVTPNFHLNGKCEEAIYLYEKAFDAEITSILRYGDADTRDWQTPLTDRQKNLIYHAEMCIGNQRISPIS
jgi:PhnB protein